MAHRPAGALEQEVLAILAASGAPLTPGDVQARMPDALAYTTVMTTLVRLHEKGAVTRQRARRGYAYAFAADTSTLTARRMRQLLERDGDRRGVLARFVAELDPDDEAVLADLLAQARTEPA